MNILVCPTSLKNLSVSIQDPTAQFLHNLTLPDNPISKRNPGPQHQE